MPENFSSITYKYENIFFVWHLLEDTGSGKSKDICRTDMHTTIMNLPSTVSTSPFFSLKMPLKTLSRDKPVIVVCSDGKNFQSVTQFHFLLPANL